MKSLDRRIVLTLGVLFLLGLIRQGVLYSKSQEQTEQRLFHFHELCGLLKLKVLDSPALNNPEDWCSGTFQAQSGSFKILLRHFLGSASQPGTAGIAVSIPLDFGQSWGWGVNFDTSLEYWGGGEGRLQLESLMTTEVLKVGALLPHPALLPMRAVDRSSDFFKATAALGGWEGMVLRILLGADTPPQQTLIVMEQLAGLKNTLQAQGSGGK